MKMVKSLLLGSAAGLVAIAGAQAADLPVKAKPVQYVKICSLYGAGFYYIPGTDTCLKIGGFVRAEMDFYANGSFYAYLGSNFSSPGTNVENTRVRYGITADARSQTAYGTLRAFVYMAPTATNGLGGGYYTPYAPAGFIQWAGFTFGNTDSFFNFNGQGYTNGTLWAGSASGGRGMPVFAYTAQFGNGLSATLSLEDTTGHSATIGGNSQVYAGREWPDLVGNLRIDQAWGSAQIMGALHNVHSYNTALANSEHHKLGYAVGGGLKVNLPMLGHGDSVIGEASYTKGALDYVMSNPAGAAGGGAATYALSTGWPAVTNTAWGDVYDAVGTTATGSLDLTTGWQVNGGYEHHWDPMWKTSLYGGYVAVNYSANASNAIRVAGTTGNSDFNVWQVGSRTVWTPVHNLDFSVDLVYSEVNGAYSGQTAGGVTYGNKGFLAGIFRVQRNF